jgi:hypothetical protein
MLSSEAKKRVVLALLAGDSAVEAAKGALPEVCSPQNARHWQEAIASDNVSASGESASDVEADGERCVTYLGTAVRTEAQAIAKGEIDLSYWRKHQLVLNHWEVGAKGPDGKLVVTPLWQVKLWLRARAQTELQLEKLAADTITQMKAHSPTYAVEKLPSRGDLQAGKMLEVDILDVHLGSLSWAAETGKDYDVDISKNRYEAILRELLALAGGVCSRPEQICLPIGNDFLHIDTERGSTTGDTLVDTDTRATRVFEIGKEVLIHAIDSLLPRTGRVIVPVVPGNHDQFSMNHLGQTIAAWYRNAGGRVQVDFRPPLRKYVQWGRCLLGFTHGSEEKRARLPMLMAAEQAEMWAKTKHRAWRVGHLHHRAQYLVPTGETIDGVYVRQSMALADRDAWHTRKGFIGTPVGASATLWDKEKGAVVEFTVAVE